MDLMLFRYERPSQLTLLAIVDMYESLIWTERFNEPGDFELKLPFNMDSLLYKEAIAEPMRQLGSSNLYILVKDMYDPSTEDMHFYNVYDTDNAMFIESYESTFESSGELSITYRGRSLLALFDRRIVFDAIEFNEKYVIGNLNKIIKRSCGSDTNEIRQFPNLFDGVLCTDFASSDFKQPAITCRGKTLLEVMNGITSTYHIGFYLKMRFTMSAISYLYVCAYVGSDVSDSILFSQDFESLTSSYFNRDLSAYHNWAYIFGEGEGGDRRWSYAISPYATNNFYQNCTGFFLKELFVDARDLSSKLEDDEVMPDDKYIALLQERGLNKLSEEAFYHKTGADINVLGSPFAYGTDYKMGDICSIRNHYAATVTDSYKVRVVEYIFCDDMNGLSAYPTFTEAGEVS